MKKKVGIIGSGVVARALAKGFLYNNYEVLVGSRTPSKLDEWKEQVGMPVQIGSMADAATFGDIIVLATKGLPSEEIIKSNPKLLDGKTIIDTTNPIAEEPPVNGVIKFFTSNDESLMERLQKAAPEANFVKAFNSVGNAYMVNPNFNGERPTMFIAGNSPEAKATVTEILDMFGWDTEDMGLAESARPIEQLCILWCLPGFLRNQWNHAFKLYKA
jgi:predicted dinucleotide-binding enzyme